MKTLLKGARVFRDGVFDFFDLVVDGVYCYLISPDTAQDVFDTVFYLNDYYILPGFLDVHVHLRQPGFSYKETIHTGTRAAARGGYTAVCSMPNLIPAPDSLQNLKVQTDMIQTDACIDVLPYACITKGEQGRELADIESLAPYVFGFTDDGKGVQDAGIMKEAMMRVKQAGSFIAAHCEDESLLNGGYIHDGIYAKKHGHRGISSASEYKQLERDLALVAQTGCRYHVCHVSTKESVALIWDAKKSGLPVTCETAPHYLLLCDEDLQEDGRFKMNPPIRSAADRDALLEGLQDGTIDMIATDHAPHAAHEKDKGLKDSAMGVVGLETAFRVLHTGLVETGVMTLAQLADKMAGAPRRIFGMGNGIQDGGYADLCVVDPNVESVIDPARFLSMGRSTPFEGYGTKGDVVMTMHHGNIVWQREETC